MRTLLKKLLFCIICLLFIFSLTSCGGNKNDKVYTLNEIEGVYECNMYNNGTSYDYSLTIKNEYAKALKESYTFEEDRHGVPHEISEIFSGKVELTKTNIKIGNHTGYIKTESGNIIITINEIIYKKM